MLRNTGVVDIPGTNYKALQVTTWLQRSVFLPSRSLARFKVPQISLNSRLLDPKAVPGFQVHGTPRDLHSGKDYVAFVEFNLSYQNMDVW